MLSKKQKRILKAIFILAIIVNLLVVLPFNSFGLKNALIESIIKFVVAPILIIGLMVYPHILKNRQVKNKEDSSKIIAVVSFYPLLSYFVSAFVFGAYLITRYDPAKNIALYSLGLAFMVALAIVAGFFGVTLPKTQSRLPLKEHIRLDVIIGIVLVIVSGVMFYWNYKLASNYVHDEISVVLFAGAVVALFANGYYLSGLFQKNGVYKVLNIHQAQALAGVTEIEKEAAEEEQLLSEVVLVDDKDKRLLPKQKQLLTILFGVSLFLSLLVIFPYNVFFGWYKFELIFKFIVLPILLLGTLVYPTLLLYKANQKDGIPQTVAISTYLPFFVSLISICTYSIYLLFAGGTVNLGTNVWGGLIAFNIIVLLVSVFLVFFFPRIQAALKRKEHLIADITLVVIYLCVNAIAGILYTTFRYVNFKVEFSVLLLFLFFILYAVLAVLYFLRVFNRESLLLEVPLTAREKVVEIEAEPKEVIVEKVVEVDVKRDLTEEEMKEIYDSCYQRAYQEALENLKEIKEQEAKAEEAKALAEAAKLEAEEAAKVEEKEATPEVVEPAKPKKPAKIIEPSFIEVINYAGSIPGVSFSVNEKQTNYKFIHNKQPFLIAVNTRSGYNLHFLAELDEIINMIVKYPDITKAKTPKGENWFKLANRGVFPEEVIFDIIEHSYEMLAVIEKRKQEEKDRIKQLKKEAREAERARLKKAQKALKQANKK
jgi:hypothetical protein